MELCRLEKDMQTPITPQKEDFSFLKNLPILYPIEGGNKDTVLQVIGKDMNQGAKYVKKIITVTQENLQYAYAQRTMMQIINSEYVVKLLYSQQKYEQSSKNEVQKYPKFIILYMEYFPNGDLHEYLTNHNPSIGQRIEIFLDILYAMRFLHQKFILHRDIKLQNIFITEDKKIKIADLGFSSQKITLAQTLVGTFGYMAPEVSFNANQGYSIEKADIWSIGFMGFQILNKPIKLDIDNQRFIRDPFMKLQILRQEVQKIIVNGGGIQEYIRLLQKKPLVFIPQIPNALKQLISQMLIPNPAKRISFRQIYENDYLNRLQLQLLNYEEFGEKKVYQMQNLVTMIRDYSQIYYLIGFNKQRMLDFERLYKLIFSRVYEKLFDRMILGGKLVPVADQETGKTCLLLLLTMRKLKAIYDIIKSSDFFMLKKVLQPYDKKISDYFIKVKNQTQIYLRKTGKKPIDQNKEILSDRYFKQLLNEVSVMHGLNAKVVQENWM